MLETRLPFTSLPSTLARPTHSPPPRRRSPGARSTQTGYAQSPRTVPRTSTPRTTVTRRNPMQRRMARSEARLLALAVGATALMCAVLVVYLAAYAHDTWLGMEQSKALTQLTDSLRENHRLQMNMADLKNPTRIAAAAKAQGMTLYTGQNTYVNVSKNVPADLQIIGWGGTGGATANSDSTHSH